MNTGRKIEIRIRPETTRDYDRVENLVQQAFAQAEYADHDEHNLVSRLRHSRAYLPELSLVAEVDGQIVGHIMMTWLKILDDGQAFDSLALAPVSVLPQYQSQGIGSQMIIKSLAIATELGFQSVIVLGHQNYYPRFGFVPASRYGINAPFEVPDDNFMVRELRTGSLANVYGMVIYPPEFFAK